MALSGDAVGRGVEGFGGGGVASAGEEVGRVGMVESQEWRALEATVEI